MKQFSMVLTLVLAANGLLLAAEKQYVDIQTITTMCQSLHQQVQRDFVPDCIIGLSRGGLIPLGLLAGETMFNNRNVRIISITSYSDEGEQSCLKLLFPVTSIEVEKLRAYNSVLIVDDIADSGRTLRYVVNMVKELLPHIEVKTAVLFYKERSIIKPDYYVEITDKWVVFPWEMGAEPVYLEEVESASTE